jgi:uncharacterized protein YndB with AHSA1/START domain
MSHFVKIRPLVLVILLVTCLSVWGLAQRVTGLKGKQVTDRSVVVEATVKATPEEVFRLWSTSEGAKKVFDTVARIDSRKGGEYTIVFDPEHDPQGLDHGSKGCRILRYEPSRLLAFEWKGTGQLTDMNAQPFPTWVEVSIDPLSDRPGFTHVTLVPYGFGHSATFDAAYGFFQSGWHEVMANFEKVVAGSGS